MAAAAGKVRARSRRRVEGDGQASTVTKSAKNRGTTRKSNSEAKKLFEVPEGAVYEITAQASELVPVAQYANVTVGPVAITRRVLISDESVIAEALEQATREIQDVVEKVVSDDREIVQESVASYNRQEAEKEKSKGNGK